MTPTSVLQWMPIDDATLWHHCNALGFWGKGNDFEQADANKTDLFDLLAGIGLVGGCWTTCKAGGG